MHTKLTQNTGAVISTPIAVSNAGAHTIVAGIEGKTIKVLNICIIASGPVGVMFKSSSNEITGWLPLAANGGFAPGFDPFGHFETAPGESLVIALSAAVNAGGWIKFQIVG